MVIYGLLNVVLGTERHMWQMTAGIVASIQDATLFINTNLLAYFWLVSFHLVEKYFQVKVFPTISILQLNRARSFHEIRGISSASTSCVIITCNIASDSDHSHCYLTSTACQTLCFWFKTKPPPETHKTHLTHCQEIELISYVSLFKLNVDKT